MRKQIWIPSLIVLAFCVLLLLYRSTRQQPLALPPTAMTPTNQQASAPAIAQSRLPDDRAPRQNPDVPNAGTVAPPRSGTEISNAIYEEMQADWQKPIDFYGKVVDENGNPMAGAAIQFRWSGLSDDQFTSATKSDGDGLFSLQGKRGRILNVSVSKGGYYNSGKDKTAYLYSLGPNIYSPDSRNPVIFHLQKKNQGEPLIEKDFPSGIGQYVQLRHDGTPIEIDLLNGQKATAGAGQLKLELWRDVSEKTAKSFDWKLQISVPSGGLVKTEEEFAFQAPERNYQPSIVLDMPKTNQSWREDITSKYYIQLPDGRYGRIDLHVLAYNGAFTIHTAINASGSRNLEPQ